MKAIIISYLILGQLCVAYSQVDNLTKAEFKRHFKTLDSLSKASPSDTIRSFMAVQYMEEKTGISSSINDGNYFGKMSCTKYDIKKWHEWFDKKFTYNKSKHRQTALK